MSSTRYYCNINSPVGDLVVVGKGEVVTGLYMPEHRRWRGPQATWRRSEAPFSAVREQLAEYFAGARRDFDVPVILTGTPFQRRVWQELARIPFGITVTYGELAERLGQPTASRAVGHANGRNPVSIIVPCHRVVGANRKLTGYAGGIERKQWLLAWEQAASNRHPVDSRELVDTTTCQQNHSP